MFFCAHPLLQVFHLDLSDCLVSGFLDYAAQSTTVEQSDWSRDLGCIAVACGMVVVVSPSLILRADTMYLLGYVCIM